MVRQANPVRSPFERRFTWPAIVFFVVYFLACRLSCERGVRPPAGVATIEAFVRSMPAPQKLARVSRFDPVQYVWLGPLSASWNLFSVPSGPPCYVFDGSGRLVDWSRDVGDDHHLDRYVQAARNAPAIPVPPGPAKK
jgi:hypothetical protein